MWLFTKHGFVDVVQHPAQSDRLLLRTQLREHADSLVRLLDQIDEAKHDVQEISETDYRFMVIAARDTVAQAVSTLIGEIDYSRFKRSVNFDLGKGGTHVVWLTPTDLQVATIKPE